MSKEDELELLSPPGDTILEHLKHELSRDLGVSHEFVERLLEGKEEITVDLAISLEHRFGIACEFWLRREENYRQRLAKLLK